MSAEQPAFRFEIIHRSTKSQARVGRIVTPHGIIDTPGFVAVGTNGTLKAIDNLTTSQLGLQLMFCNTYHLMLYPGSKTVQAAGGLHRFVQRSQPIITDSGGFQVFSLAYGTVRDELKSKGSKKSTGSVLKITEDGVWFRSYRDGELIHLSPESTILAQKELGADIIIPLDELPPYHIEPQLLRDSLERTHRWEIRSLNTHLADPKQQAIYAVVHGGIDPQLRQHSANYLAKYPFDGFAIGGSMGKNQIEMVIMLSALMPCLQADPRPVHLLGIGDIPAIRQLIPLGIDTFDSSYPTKAARHGVLLQQHGAPIHLGRGCYRNHFESIPDCLCPTCQHHHLSFLHHLFKTHEPIFGTLASIHNLYTMLQLMKSYRQLILDNKI